jgi:hypothetical protein
MAPFVAPMIETLRKRVGSSANLTTIQTTTSARRRSPTASMTLEPRTRCRAAVAVAIRAT